MTFVELWTFVCLGSLIPVRQLVPSVGGADWNFGVSSSLYAT